ncbi:MAG: LTA synthase family protein [Chlamydiae bacterium]|nr:LTA synthase family protein [Chlamydiota bacterium]
MRSYFSLFIPILLLRLLFFRRLDGGVIQDIALTFQLMWLSLWLPYPIYAGLLCSIFIYLALDAFLYHRHRLRMRFNLLVHIKDFSSFKHSLAHEKPLLFFVMVFLLCIEVSLASYYWKATLSTWVMVSVTLLAWSLKPQRYNCLIDEELRGIKKLLPKRKKKPCALQKKLAGDKTLYIHRVPQERPHIVFLLLESFRAKDIGCLNQGQGVTPYFDALAKEGLLFTQFYANELLSFRALLASLYGTLPPPDCPQLPQTKQLWGIPQLVQTLGYERAYFHSGDLHFTRQKGFFEEQRFEYIAGKQEILRKYPQALITSWGVYDEYLMQYAMQHLEQQKNPLFMTLFTITNHHPWIPPPGMPPQHSSLYERFKTTMAYTDKVLGQFIQRLRETGLSKKTLLFIMGDHGQPMGEHRNLYSNLISLYEETVHIPLLILADGRLQEPKIIKSLGSQLDLLPTLADLFEQKGAYIGDSLLRCSANKCVFMQNTFEKGYWGLREGEHKYIFTKHSQQEELYHLKSDPGELSNIGHQHRATLRIYKEKVHHFFSHFESELALTGCQETWIQASNLRLTDLLVQHHLNQFPHTLGMDLSHCLCLTEESVAYILHHAKKLQWLKIKGLDLTDRLAELLTPQKLALSLLDIRDNPKLTLKSLQPLIEAMDNLAELGLDGVQLKSSHYPLLFKSIPYLSVLKLQHGYDFSDDNTHKLFLSHPYIQDLHLENCPHITDKTVDVLCGWEGLLHLCIVRCPKISSQGRERLKALPLVNLILA